MSNINDAETIQGWVVSVEFTGPVSEDHEALAVRVIEEAAGVSVGHASSAPGRVGTIITVDSASWGNAASIVSSAVKRVLGPAWDLVDLRVQTEAEQEAELERPVFPPMLGITEAADILGVTRQRASQLFAEGRLPTPVVELASGPVFVESAVRAFAAQPRRAGRPAKVTP